jgi:NTE family protein
MFERKKVGVALSSGGLKGLAQIGVLEVLEEYDIPIDLISGTSIGAVIGALYSAEPNAKKLEKEALREPFAKLFDYTFPRYGFIKGDKIEQYLQEQLHGLTFNDLKIPLYVTAFDLAKRREIIFHRGNVVKAVRASISIPGVFIPVENNQKILVDGGVVDPVPTEILRKEGADIVIAVNVSFLPIKPPLYEEKAKAGKGTKKLPSILQSTFRSLEIMGAESSRADLAGDKADCIININLEHMGMFDYSKAKKAIATGRTQARKLLKEIQMVTLPNPFTNFLQELKKSLEIKGLAKLHEEKEDD